MQHSEARHGLMNHLSPAGERPFTGSTNRVCGYDGRVAHSTARLAPVHGDHERTGFNHEAFLYAGRDEFLHGTTTFVREGVAAGQPALVVVGAEKIELLRAE